MKSVKMFSVFLLIVTVIIISAFFGIANEDLLEAVKGGDIQKTQEMLAQEPDLLNINSSEGYSLLHYAVMDEQKEMAKFLIDRGLSVNITDNKENTPLHLAAGSGNLEMVALLISAGADINAKNSYGTTPIHEACWKGNGEIVDFFLSKNAKIDEKDSHGNTSLHDAVWYEQYDIVELLIAAGADVNIRNNNGELPLDLAKSEEIKELLLLHGSGEEEVSKYLQEGDILF